MDWVGTIVAAAITVLGASLTLAVGSRIKGEWWPGQLRRAKQISEVLEELSDLDPATASALRRERDEALQSWMLRGRVPGSNLRTFAWPFFLAGFVAVMIGGVVCVINAIRALLETLPVSVPSETLVLLGLVIAAVGFAFMLATVPLASKGVRAQRRTTELVRTRFGFGSTLDEEARQAIVDDLENRTGEKRQKRTARAE